MGFETSLTCFLLVCLARAASEGAQCSTTECNRSLAFIIPPRSIIIFTVRPCHGNMLIGGFEDIIQKGINILGRGSCKVNVNVFLEFEPIGLVKIPAGQEGKLHCPEGTSIE